MSQTRREFIVSAAALAAGMLSGRSAPQESACEKALRAACAFLAERQSPDGAWRSATYGAFRNGDALTPLVVDSLARNHAVDAEPVARGIGWLKALTKTQSERTEPWAGLGYPLFTASYTAQVFARMPDSGLAVFWANVIGRLRIREELGWPADAAACGAWSDAPMPPVFPPGSAQPPDMLAPNGSATLLAVEALVAARCGGDAAGAQNFLEQCQNFAASPDALYDDGGFFFAIGDPVRNKAGIAGRDAAGRERYRSYGSATCDAVLALDACGVPLEAPRMRAAFEWLRIHAAGAGHSGDWPSDRRDERESLRYYHAQAFAAVLALAETLPEYRAWAAGQRRVLAADLIAAQRSDGSWIGACPDSFEDDPVVATAFAVRALCQCAAPSAHRAVSRKAK